MALAAAVVVDAAGVRVKCAGLAAAHGWRQLWFRRQRDGSYAAVYEVVTAATRDV